MGLPLVYHHLFNTFYHNKIFTYLLGVIEGKYNYFYADELVAASVHKIILTKAIAVEQVMHSIAYKKVRFGNKVLDISYSFFEPAA